MKSPNFVEFQSLVEYLTDELSGAQLQDVQTSDEGVVLSFYRYDKSPQTLWVVFDLDNQFPFLGIYPQNPWAGLKSIKPLGLFIKANFKNNVLDRLSLFESYGRVVRFVFNTDFYIEFRSIPKQPNLIAVMGKKQVAWSKPKDLIQQNDRAPEDIESRSIPYMLQDWLKRRQVHLKKKKGESMVSADAYDIWVRQRQKDIEKKRKALSLLQNQINNPLIQQYQNLGDFLKVYGDKNIPEDLVHLMNYSQSVSWNIQNCFHKAKQLKDKITGAAKRAQFIQEELVYLDDLSKEKFNEHLKKQAQIKEFRAQRDKPSGDYRKLNLTEDGMLVCLMGKSAADNLKLLRQSKSWDYWIHLKDYPSAHAIIQRNKNQKISDDSLIKACQWLAKESVKSNDSLKGARLSAVIVECRHVRPIKGDKIGRVTYHHPREMLITV